MGAGGVRHAWEQNNGPTAVHVMLVRSREAAARGGSEDVRGERGSVGE